MRRSASEILNELEMRVTRLERQANSNRTASRSLSEIAKEIRLDWGQQKGGIYFGAKPYLDAMRYLGDINDNYGADDARSIVLYFLSNASKWRGPVAKSVKAELKKMLKQR